MAKKDFTLTANETLVDVVATKGDKVYVKTMTIEEARLLKKEKGWKYQNYQVGYHSYKTNI